MASQSLRVEPGLPYPLGATWDGKGVNFALFSAHAERVQLCVFDHRGQREIARVDLPEYTHEVWHGYLPDARPGLLYGYRVFGPYEPRAGHRFNPHKLLIDPCAKALHGRIAWSDAHFGYRVGARQGDLSFDRRDNARGMPKCMVIDPAYTWDGDRHPRTPWSNSIIYEAHVRGFTMQRDAVPAALRGSFAGLAHPAAIEHLQKLGVTAIELLPVQAFLDDRYLIERQLSNYWGYNSIGFFAPMPRYLATGHVGEFKAMVRHLHEAGIEVILDVVYNHTAEGNHLGPTLSFRGIDNRSYYRLMPGDERHYEDFTGCGNALRLHHPRVLQMVMDSLRYWVEEMHVDGFRFDLATTLAREADGAFDPHSGFLDVLRQDPVLGRIKLIAEPWDVGVGGYQVGQFPPDWAEWNDKFRDIVRRFWKGEGGLIGELAGRMSGSQDLFGHAGRRPWSSINFVTAHDGFTLRDLVSYEHKHNEANQEGNRDGSDNNNSWNCGVEGATDDAAVLALRARQQRNLLATLLLAQGVPMLLAGDELGNSQDGNNNAYCQDNPIGWIDGPDRHDNDLFDFACHLIRIRREHRPLRRRNFLTGSRFGDNGLLRDVVWLAPSGEAKTQEDWNYPDARILCFLLADPHATDKSQSADAPLFIVLNAHHDDMAYTLPDLPGISAWLYLIDTSTADGKGRQAPVEPRAQVEVAARSVVVLCGHHGTGAGG
ncbi:glycogen debranching protein GlgX [Desertibaculum subflavum]|uniref:glycogen debranching protein GlgX n=1 Tax=Desertibaculum subflavum TaxID=2268458 RepID=UPI000E6683FA